MPVPVPFPGYSFEHAFEFSQAQVKQFADLTGDRNPVHLDEVYAATTPFRKPIMHGFLSGSIFSKVFGTIYPGEGTIYIEQQLIFKRPMFAGQGYVAKCKVVEVNKDKGTVSIDCIVEDADGKVCLQGVARLMNKGVFNP
jgi:acyl dehydratase